MTPRRALSALTVALLLPGCRPEPPPQPFDLPAPSSDVDLVKQGALNGGVSGSDPPGSSVAGGHYQFPYLGLGGVALLLSPDGAAAPMVETSAPKPGIFLEDLWDGGSRVSCFAVTSRVVGSKPPAEKRALRFRQQVSLREGVAHTAYEEKVDGRTVASLVTTFVTPEGVVVLHFEDRVGSEAGKWRQIALLADPQVAQSRQLPPGYVIRAKKGRASAWAALQVPQAERYGLDGRQGRLAASAPLPGFRQATVAFLAFATGPDAGGQALAPATAASWRGYDACLEATRRWWANFWAASSVELPDAQLQRWYDRSLFQLGCAFGGALARRSLGEGGPVGPMGLVPSRWGGHIFAHDLTYMHYALVTSNRADLTLPLIRWYAQVLPTAQQHAREAYHLPGARYGWEQDAQGHEVAGSPFSKEHHVNGEVAFQAYTQALWTGDKEAMRLTRQILPPTTRFLCAHMQRADVGTGFTPVRGLYVSPQSTDLDERAQLVRGGISTQLATDWSLRAADELDCLPDDLRPYLHRIFLPKADWRGQEVLVVYDGDHPNRSLKHPAPLVGVWWWPVTDPNSDLARRTYDSVRARLNLEKTPTFNCPWLACISARMQRGDAALDLLHQLLASPGAVVDDTCFAESPGGRWTPFLTTSGALVSAVHEMLLQSWQHDEVSVFPALPSQWTNQNVAFDNLLARGGITVSANYSPPSSPSASSAHSQPPARSRSLLLPECPSPCYSSTGITTPSTSTPTAA